MSAAHARIERLVGGLTRLRRAFDAGARRERILLIGAAMAVAAMAGDWLWLSPAFEHWQAARRRAALAHETLQTLNSEVAQRVAASMALDAQVQRDVAQWREKVRAGDAELRAVGTSLITASEMLPVLEHMLAQSGGLHLRSMQSLPRVELTASPNEASAAAAAATAAASAPANAAVPANAPALYRHGVELTVEGGYADLLAYLEALETMPQRVLWGGVQLKVAEYPKAVLTLRLYTLSMDRGWLEI